MSTLKVQSEQVGEAFAHQVLKDHFGAEVFIGPGIEIKLQELANVIYQSVPDLSYFGATVYYDTGEKFVALNTNQPLRIRYFTAAHELWHVLGFKEMMLEKLDHERAADRFAAAIMMPETLIRLLWAKLKKNLEQKKAIIKMADMASIPYEAMARRVKDLELTISANLLELTDVEWTGIRKEYLITDTPLDQAFPLESFNKYEMVIKEAIDQNMFNQFEAASKLSQVSPSKAQIYQHEEMSKKLSVEANEEQEE